MLFEYLITGKDLYVFSFYTDVNENPLVSPLLLLESIAVREKIIKFNTSMSHPSGFKRFEVMY